MYYTMYTYIVDLWTVRERYSCQNLLENAVRIPRPPRPPWITYQACLNLNDMDSFNRKLVKDINSSMDYTLATTCRSLLALASLHTPAPRSYFYFFSENHSPNKKYELPSNILRKLIRVPTLGNFHPLSQTEDL